MTDNPAPLPVEAKKSKGLWHRAFRLVIGVGLIVVIFASVIPQFASFADAWTAIQSMSMAWLVALIVAGAVRPEISYVWPYQAALKFTCGTGTVFSRPRQARSSRTRCPLVINLTVGMTFRMFGSFGFSKELVSLTLSQKAGNRVKARL